MIKKVCKDCKIFAEKDVCPICKGSNFTTTWKGRIIILDNEKSEIAKKLSVKNNGEYAIKIR